jgi:anti-anti-sigma factor
MSTAAAGEKTARTTHRGQAVRGADLEGAPRAKTHQEVFSLQPVPFEVGSRTAAAGVEVLSVRGELDLNTASEFEQMLDEAIASGGSVVVDLSTCDFIDSTGVALLVRAWQGMGDGASPRRLILCCPKRQVSRLFEITGLNDEFEIEPDVEQAVEAAAGGRSQEAR